MDFAASGYGEQNFNEYINWNLVLDNQDPTPVMPAQNLYPQQTINYAEADSAIGSRRIFDNSVYPGFNTAASYPTASYSAAGFQNQAIFWNQEPQRYYQAPYATFAGVDNYPRVPVNSYNSGLNSTISVEAPLETILPLEIGASQNIHVPLLGQQIDSGAIVNYATNHFETRELSAPIYPLGIESGLWTVVNYPFDPSANVPIAPMEAEFGFGTTANSQFGLLGSVPMVPPVPESQLEIMVNSEFALLENDNTVSPEPDGELRDIVSPQETLVRAPFNLLAHEPIAPPVSEIEQESVVNPLIERIGSLEPENVTDSTVSPPSSFSENQQQSGSGATVSPTTSLSQNQKQSGPIAWTYYENQIESDSSDIESPRGEFKPISKAKKNSPEVKKARPRKEIRMFTASQQLKLNFRKFKPCDPLIRETEQFDGDEDFWCHLCAKDDGFDRVYNFVRHVIIHDPKRRALICVLHGCTTGNLYKHDIKSHYRDFHGITEEEGLNDFVEMSTENTISRKELEELNKSNASKKSTKTSRKRKRGALDATVEHEEQNESNASEISTRASRKKRGASAATAEPEEQSESNSSENSTQASKKRKRGASTATAESREA
ncbi:expressed protein [Phakopsora pachyrhizi]|uniref:Expressed protein n=1 Tax=Phakopsora pachyrhizi TaxID=170000 RepID=A0AAV0AH83_PHAPC|nr:expressed protein [Phakopsora pachyrhizi]